MFGHTERNSPIPSHAYFSEQKTDHLRSASPPSKRRVTDSSLILLGICAIRKKLESRSMREIINRLRCRQIEILEMSEWLQRSWESWPRVDALICFHSDGFPYLMAWKYIQKHKPFLINDFDRQQLLWDRSVVYHRLRKINVPLPKHYFVCRDPQERKTIENRGIGNYVSDEEYLISDYKNSEHHIRSYQLARKKHHPPPQEPAEESGCENNLGELPPPKLLHKLSERNEIYLESFYPRLLENEYASHHSNQGTTEIDEFEDYIILRNGDHTHRLEKPFVQKPFSAFDHEICIYYPQSMGGGRKRLTVKSKDECGRFQPEENAIRRNGNFIYEEYLPTNGFIIKVYAIGPYYMHAQARKSVTLDGVVHRNAEGKEMRFPVMLTPEEKLLCNKIVQEFGQEVCGIELLRSGCLSFVCSVNGWSFAKNSPRYWNDCAVILKRRIFHHFCPEKTHHLARAHFEQFVQDTYRPPLNHPDVRPEQLRSIVTIFRHADRSPKQKLKIRTKDPRFIALLGEGGKEVKLKDAKSLTRVLAITNEILSELSQGAKDFQQLKAVLESGGRFEGLTRKVQVKASDKDKSGVKEVIVVMKWGGELSYAGHEDAVELGRKMRNEKYDHNDCLSLFASYRHDLKTYSSDEGRCVKTAAAFIKGLLGLQGELAPIITSMVTTDKKAQRLLDCTSEQNHSPLLQRVAQQLSRMLNSEEPLLQNFLREAEKSEASPALLQVAEDIGVPKRKLEGLLESMKKLSTELGRVQTQHWKQDCLSERAGPHQKLEDESQCEDILLVRERWRKLLKDFYDKDSALFSISKLPEIYDTIRHDLRKNKAIFDLIDNHTRLELKRNAKNLARFVVPNERGITNDQKIETAKTVCLPLLEKVLQDLLFWKTKNTEESFWKYRSRQDGNWRHIRTRLYFTSASHLHSLLNLLVLGNNRELLRLSDPSQAEQAFNVLCMGYLSRIQFRLYENLTRSQQDSSRFRIEISLAQGYKRGQKGEEISLGGQGMTIGAVQQFIESNLRDPPPVTPSLVKRSSSKD